MDIVAQGGCYFSVKTLLDLSPVVFKVWESQTHLKVIYKPQNDVQLHTMLVLPVGLQEIFKDGK